LGALTTQGDKLLSNKQLSLGNLNLRDPSAPIKEFLNVPFLRCGSQLGAPPMLGDKMLPNKRLILGDLKVLGATQPFTVFMTVTSWGAYNISHKH
jgi:hypothetical protein